MADLTGAAELITAVTGVILGGAGYWRARKKDDITESAERASVPRKDFEAASAAWRQITGELRKDVDDLRRRYDHDIQLLRDEVANCERDKAVLTARVTELERA